MEHKRTGLVSVLAALAAVLSLGLGVAVLTASPAAADHCTTTAGADGILGNADDETTCTTATPKQEAVHSFDDNWGQVPELVKGMAPKVILAGLVLLAVRKVVNGISRARAPKF